MPNKWYNIRAKGESAAEILIYDEIGFELTAKDFAHELKSLGNVATLNVRVNSPGGFVFDGIAIYHTLRRHPARKIVDIDGLAASISSLIVMAGDERRIAQGALMMVHNPHGGAYGQAHDLRAFADTMDQAKNSIIGIYADRTGLPRDKIAGYMDAETWMEPGDAVEFGFVDSLSEHHRQIAAHVDLSKFHNVPASLRKAMAEPPPLREYRNRIDSNVATLARLRR